MYYHLIFPSVGWFVSAYMGILCMSTKAIYTAQHEARY